MSPVPFLSWIVAKVTTTAVKNVSGAGKDVTGAAKDISGIQKDLVDTELGQRNIAKMDARIVPATFEDVKQYDLKVRKLILKRRDLLEAAGSLLAAVLIYWGIWEALAVLMHR